MHAEAMAWVQRYATTRPVSVLDLGGRDVNGTVRHLFPNATIYRVVDILPGEDVDVVADAADWEPDQQYDTVLSAECFEHTVRWPEICVTAFKACKPGGRLILTMAGPGRPEHSAIDGEFRLHPGEYYANVDPARLWRVLHRVGWRDLYVDQQFAPCDVRAAAVRPRVAANALPASLTMRD